MILFSWTFFCRPKDISLSILVHYWGIEKILKNQIVFHKCTRDPSMTLEKFNNFVESKTPITVFEFKDLAKCDGPVLISQDWSILSNMSLDKALRLTIRQGTSSQYQKSYLDTSFSYWYSIFQPNQCVHNLWAYRWAQQIFQIDRDMSWFVWQK